MNNLTEKNLVETIGSNVIGTPSGLKAQQAQAELNRRLIVSLRDLKVSTDKNNQKTDKFNKLMVNFNIALLLVAVIQVITSVFDPDSISLPYKVAFMAAPLYIVYLTFKN